MVPCPMGRPRRLQITRSVWIPLKSLVLLGRLQNRPHLSGDGLSVLPKVLGTLGRDRPGRPLRVQLCPPHPPDLAVARGGVRYEFETPDRRGVGAAAPHPLEAVRDLRVVRCPVMAGPGHPSRQRTVQNITSWIISSQPPSLRPCEDPANILSDPPARRRHVRMERFQDVKNLFLRDLRHRPTPQLREHVLLHPCQPLGRIVLAAPVLPEGPVRLDRRLSE